MRILLVEDDHRLNQSLKLGLVDEGYAVDSAFDGLEGEAFAQATSYDVIILDIMLPHKDGILVCRSLRSRKVNTPILMLTARDAIEDRVQGLDSGADDYLVKPFSLHELLARLRALLRRTAADASHELRTPLSIVDLEAERALAQEHTPQQYQQAITTIQQENRRMTRLVNDLLVLARADASQTKLRHEPVDLSEVVVDTVERLALLAQQTGIAIKVAQLPEMTILGDRVYLAQMLTNIIENALKYSASSGTRVEVELVRHNKRGRGWAELRVRDDGPGIAKEHLSHLFERFYRVDQSRTHSGDLAASAGDGATSGNGLGLSIAQWIAQGHGGEIQVRSAAGHGSIFAVWLPLEPTGAAAQTNFHTFTALKHKEATDMSHQMDYTERGREESPPYATGYQETPGFNSYATGQGMFSAGQKLSGSAGKTSTASQRLVLAIVSLVLWVITLFGTIGIAIGTQGGPTAGVYVLLIMVLFSMLIAVINVVYNRSST